jgi:hypothetical protein
MLDSLPPAVANMATPTGQIAKLSNRDAQGNHLLQWGAGRRWESAPSTRPLLVIVHPGDALEHPAGWDHKVYAEVLAQSIANQRGMAVEIVWKAATHDVVIVHRMSSADLSPSKTLSWVDPDYRRAIQRASADAVMLYGDDTERLADWLTEHAGLEHRAEVFLTGAYSDAVYGCVTDIGQRLVDEFRHLRSAVSQHSPTDAAGDRPRWQPPEPDAKQSASQERLRA